LHMKRMFTVCLLAKWDILLNHIQQEPNGLFKDPRNHLIFSTLMKRLLEHNIDLADFNVYKKSCENQFKEANYIPTMTLPPSSPRTAIPSPPLSSPSSSDVNPEYTLTHTIEGVHPLKRLLDEVSRGSDPAVVLINFFRKKFATSYKLSQNIPNALQCQYNKIKSVVIIMIRFLDQFPDTEPLTLEEAETAVNRIRYALLTANSIDGKPRVKYQGKGIFNRSSRMSLTLIRSNKMLLTNKTAPWYRPFPENTPDAFRTSEELNS
jgi:hypothetical protein